MARRNFDPVAAFFHEVGKGVADVRHKVVEEGWFGREVTPESPNMAERLGWETSRAKAQPEQNREQDQDLDR